MTEKNILLRFKFIFNSLSKFNQLHVSSMKFVTKNYINYKGLEMQCCKSHIKQIILPYTQ